MSVRSAVIVGIAMEAAYLSFYAFSPGHDEMLLFIVVNALAIGPLAYMIYRIRSTETIPPGLLPVIVAFGILFRLTLVFHAPVASDDIYRYVWDGKVAAQGINPFALAPIDPALASLHTEELPSKINFPEMRTIYPPLAQLLFLGSNLLFGDSVVGLKLLLTCFDVASIFLFLPLLTLSGLRKEYLVLYSWSPLPIMYFGLDGHIDALGIPFLLVFLLLLFTKRSLVGVFSLGLAALAKLYPLFIVPLLLRSAAGVKRFILPAIPVMMFAAGCWFYLEPTGGLYESLVVYSSTWEFNGSVFKLLWMVLGSSSVAHLTSGILFALLVVVLLLIDRPILEKVFLGFLGFIILAPVVHPWYLTWLAALIVLRWSLAVFVLLALSNVSNIVVYHYQLSGVWQDRTLLLVIEYVPFFLLLIWEIAKGKFSVVTSKLSLQEQ